LVGHERINVARKFVAAWTPVIVAIHVPIHTSVIGAIVWAVIASIVAIIEAIHWRAIKTSFSTVTTRAL
jgi:hypothetical protein